MTALVIVSVHTGVGVEQHRFRDRTTCDVGRSPDCGIRIDDSHRSVSRRHCRLDIDPPRLRVRVRDLGSSYGTYVSGGHRLGRLTEHPLAHGDEIRIGDVWLRIAVVDEPDGMEAAPDEPAAFTSKGVRGYELIRELGRGSQGVVHLARHLESGELVALKHVLATGTVDETALFAFRRELASIRALHHPNIVELRDSGNRHDELHFVCEYCPGGDLRRLTARHGGKVPVAEALTVTQQVLSGLAYAHQADLPRDWRSDGVDGAGDADGADGAVPTARGLVHRDVKPANILLSTTGPDASPVVKLADFGLAKAFEHAGLSGHTRTGALGGTVPFTARTQLVSYKYAEPEVDVWATAACLYWMLTGATPRDFPPHKDPIAVALREPVVRIRDRDPSIPPRLADVIDEALVDTPHITIRTADELAGALRDTW